VRKTIFAVVVLGVALAVQLVVLNGLRLPGGAVPDLVLVLVAALAMTDGPVRGMVTGFVAGLCLDLAPPGSALLGEYALALCLVGWAAGKLSGMALRSAVLSVALLAVVVALGESLVAALSLALDPAQTSWSEVRQVLPYSVAYDLAALPFALCVAMLLRAWEARAVARQTAGGVLAGAGAAAGHGRKAKKYQPRQPRLAEGFARPHDGWVGSRPAGLAGAGRAAGRAAALRRPSAPHGLRPANGVAGSAVRGPTFSPGLPRREVNLRLASRHRRDGAVGSTFGRSLGHPGLHPGSRPGTTRKFRPHAGLPGGSAAMQSASMVQPMWRRPVSLSFGSRRGDGSVGRLFGSSLSALVAARSRKKASPRFRGTSSATSPAVATRKKAEPHFRHASSAIQPGLAARKKAEPRFRHTSSAFSPGVAARKKAEPRFRRTSSAFSPGVAARKKAEPRFRRSSPAFSTGIAAGLNGGRLADQHAIMAARRRTIGVPRVRFGSRRRGDGALGGSVLGASGLTGIPNGLRKSARPASPRFKSRSMANSTGRQAKQPRFGYGRRSLLTFLVGRRIGGKWLATTRVGTRSGVWLLGKRTGGSL